MADSLQGTEPPARPNFPHDWRGWDDYHAIHLSYMRTLEREGFVLEDTLSFEHIESRGELVQVHVYGLIYCSDNVIIDVDKWLESDGSAIRGVDYTYHAFVPGDSDQKPVLRYDNAHGPFHRHIFDLETGELRDLRSLTRDEFPTLDRVIREAVHRVRGDWND